MGDITNELELQWFKNHMVKTAQRRTFFNIFYKKDCEICSIQINKIVPYTGGYWAQIAPILHTPCFNIKTNPLKAQFYWKQLGSVYNLNQNPMLKLLG